MTASDFPKIENKENIMRRQGKQTYSKKPKAVVGCVLIINTKSSAIMYVIECSKIILKNRNLGTRRVNVKL